MRKQDYNGVRTAVDVERRHNLGAISGLESDVKELKVDQIIDSSLSGTSEHAVQNKVITTAIKTLDNNKVDKVSGKGLSTNDFTDEDKEKIHSHENKTLLDTINNSNQVHEHANKTLLDNLSSSDLYNIDKSHPVSSVYLSTTNTNPNTSLGGTWTSIGSISIGTTTVYGWERTS